MSNPSSAGPYYVGIDCGTQSAKVVIVDRSGNEVARGQRMLRPMDRPRNGVAVHPDDDLWDSIAAASRSALDQFPGDRADIAGVGFCVVRCCKAFLHPDGSLTEPVISWMDDRAYQPYMPADPDLAYATTSSGYIGHRLTGRVCDTAANCVLLQWPIDTATWQWSDDPTLAPTFGITEELLPDLVMPGEIIGSITDDASIATGLPAGLPVVATANDKAVEMLGAGHIGERTALVSLGTYIAAMVPGRRYHAEPVSFWTNFASVPERYLYESNGVRRGMWTITWFLDLLGDEFRERAETRGLSREQAIELEAADVPAGSDGLATVLDWLAPTDRPYRKGAMLGFDARHTRAHLYRSILEAIALTMKQNVDAMCDELAIELDDIVVSGGGSNSPLFMQILADVFDLPARRSLTGGGAGLGAAICAAAAVGPFADIDAATDAMTGDRETYRPAAENAAHYAALVEAGYHDIRVATDPLFERFFPITN